VVDKKLSWRAREHIERKSGNWYWAVGILSAGGAVASIVAHNPLLAFLLVAGGFTVMLAGSRPSTERRYTIDEVGIHIDAHIVSWNKIRHFALTEDSSPNLTIETETLLGVVAMPLSGVDFRDVRMELKNRNVEEVDSLETFVGSITKALGL